MADLLTKIRILLDSNAKEETAAIQQEVDKVPGIFKNAWNAAKAYLVYRFSVEGLKEFFDLADRFNQLEARVKLATATQAQFNRALGDIQNIARDTRTDLDSIGALYLKVNLAVKTLGGTQKDTADLTKTIAEAFRISGASAQESSAGIQQLSQALGSGVLRGDEFNSVMENAPRLAQAMAEGLNTPISQLRTLAEAGALTSDKVLKALLGQKDVLAAEFASIPKTVGSAITEVGNQLEEFVGAFDKTTGASKKAIGVIETFGNNIANVAGIVATAGAAFAIQGVKGITSWVGALELSRLAARDAAAEQVKLQAQQQATLRAELQSAEAAEAEAVARRTAAAAAVQQAEAELLLAENQVRANLGATSATTAQTAATGRLQAAQAQLVASETAVVTATERVGVASAAAAGTVEAAATRTSLATKAIGALTGALGVAQAAFIGFEVGNLLNKFESVRNAGSYLVEGFVLAGAAFENMGKVLSGKESFDQLEVNLQKIRKDFDDQRVASSAAAIAAQESADKQSKAYNELQKSIGAITPEAAKTDAEIKKLSDTYDQAKIKLDAVSKGITDTKQAQADFTTATSAYNAAVQNQVSVQTLYEAEVAKTGQAQNKFSDLLRQAENELKLQKAALDAATQSTAKNKTTNEELKPAIDAVKAAQDALTAALNRRVTAEEANVQIAKANIDSISSRTAATNKELAVQEQIATHNAEELRDRGQITEALKAEASAVEAAAKQMENEANAKIKVIAELEKEAAAYDALMAEKQKIALVDSVIDDAEAQVIAQTNAAAVAAHAAADGAKAEFEALTSVANVLPEVVPKLTEYNQTVVDAYTKAKQLVDAAKDAQAQYEAHKISLTQLQVAQSKAAGAVEGYKKAVELTTQAEQDHINVLKSKANAISAETSLVSGAIDIKIRQQQAIEKKAAADGDEKGAMQAKLAVMDLEVQKADAIAAGKEREAQALYKVVDALTTQANADGKLTDAEQQTIDSAKQSADAKEQEAAASRENAKALKDEADTAKKAAKDVKDASKDTTNEIKAGEAVISEFAGIFQRLGEYGKGFQDQLLALGHALQGTQDWWSDINFGAATLDRLDGKLAEANELVKGLGSEDMSTLIDAFNKATGEAFTMSRTTFGVNSYLSELGEQKLGPLQAAIDSATAKLRSLQAAAIDSLRSAKEELLQIQGNQKAIEDLEFDAKKADLEQKIRNAEGNAELQRTYQEELNIREQTHNLKLKSLKDEQTQTKTLQDQGNQQELDTERQQTSNLVKEHQERGVRLSDADRQAIETRLHVLEEAQRGEFSAKRNLEILQLQEKLRLAKEYADQEVQIVKTKGDQLTNQTVLQFRQEQALKKQQLQAEIAELMGQLNEELAANKGANNAARLETQKQLGIRQAQLKEIENEILKSNKAEEVATKDGAKKVVDAVKAKGEEIVKVEKQTEQQRIEIKRNRINEEIKLEQGMIDLRSKALTIELDRAEGEGKTLQVLDLKNQINQVAIEKAQSLVKEKKNEENAAYALADALVVEARADGKITEAEADAIEAARRAAASKRLERESAQLDTAQARLNAEQERKKNLEDYRKAEEDKRKAESEARQKAQDEAQKADEEAAAARKAELDKARQDLKDFMDKADADFEAQVAKNEERLIKMISGEGGVDNAESGATRIMDALQKKSAETNGVVSNNLAEAFKAPEINVPAVQAPTIQIPAPTINATVVPPAEQQPGQQEVFEWIVTFPGFGKVTASVDRQNAGVLREIRDAMRSIQSR